MTPTNEMNNPKVNIALRTISHLFENENGIEVVCDGQQSGGTWIGTLPALYPEWIAGSGFVRAHNVRFPYVVGAMANGITSVEMVSACAHEGILCFFGAAGLDEKTISDSLNRIEEGVPENASWGANLIHAPHEPLLEMKTAELLVSKNIKFVSASAFLKLTTSIIYVAFSGIRTTEDGTVIRPRSIFAKISRPETAKAFMEAPPQHLLDELIAKKLLSIDEANIAATQLVATDIIVESDSGGHTDNQSLGAIFPRISMLREELNADVRLGAAGGLGSPRSVAAAFSLGADFVLTGSVNQTTIESGLSFRGRKLLEKADIGDVMMAPAADMFEMGVKLQVLKRGTMFGVRALKLWEIYQDYSSFEAMPEELLKKLENEILGESVSDIWAECQQFFGSRDPTQLVKASQNSRHMMALVFRWYLGKSSRWAIVDKSDRVLDFQIWCGPAIAAFNSWSKGSFLEATENRSVVQIAKNLMEGAAYIVRANQLRQFGVELDPDEWRYAPVPNLA